MKFCLNYRRERRRLFQITHSLNCCKLSLMKPLYSIILLLALHFSAHSQITDTCDYVAQNNTLGGLDCAVVSTAPYTADSYQWLYCDSLFTPIPNQTSDWYTGTTTSIFIALEVTVYGCIDTSYCQYVCTPGLEELYANNIELIKIVDLMGRDSEDKPNTLQVYIYSDGTTEKVFRIE